MQFSLYDGDMMINVLKEIEYILIGLHNMGSYCAEKAVREDSGLLRMAFFCE